MELKHAYLVMAHNDFKILENTIKLIDDFRNDIYIHIDKKVVNFNFEYFLNLPKKSKIYFIDRIDTRWGDFSLVECELKLLEEATKHEYRYYHLLSGVDLPIKTQDEIHNFFIKNEGKEFVHFCNENIAKHIDDRVKYYYFMKYYRTNNKYLNYAMKKLTNISVWIQKK